MRADYNVPVHNGKITDDYRIQQSLPTLKYLLDKNCKIVVTAHLGRPGGKPDKSYSLKPVANRLSKLLGKKVTFVEDTVGEKVTKAVDKAQNSEVLLLENVRYYKEETDNDTDFAKRIVDSSRAELFVQDCFGVVHRAHASIEGVTHYLQSVAGLLLVKEVDSITEATDNPERPLMTIIGGVKIADKIDVLKRFIDIADFVVVGGAMANTFLLARGIEIGESKADPSEISLAKDIIEKAGKKAKSERFVFYIPQDGVVAKKNDKTAHTRIVDWDAHVIASVENYPKKAPRTSAQVAEDELILDIGPFSGAFIAGGMQLANTVIWNGAMGVTETKGLQGPVGPFAHGTELIVEAMLGEYGHKPFTLLGGGDTVGYIEARGLTEKFNHVSTGGGACLELMSGKSLPGIQALEDN